MKNYELVCVIDSTLSTEAIASLRSTIEKMVPTIVATDEMGLLPLAYPSQGQDQAYFVSYHIQATGADIDAMKKEMRILKGLTKFFFYGMKEGEKLLVFADVQKKFETMLTADEEKQAKREVVQEEDEEGEEEATERVEKQEEA